MNFAEAAIKKASFTRTENGAIALNTSGSKCLDFFSTIGALRGESDSRLFSLFEEAYKEDPLKAIKIVFYCRDIREGLGEREIFRRLIAYIANKYPEALERNLGLFGTYGRFDDLYSMLNTELEHTMWNVIAVQLHEDIRRSEQGESVSLLAKWLKTPDASSRKTRELGIRTAVSLGFRVRDYKRILHRLRKEIKITEAYMSANKWDEIEYSHVPSRAMMIYRNAFYKHDGDRFQEFATKASKGEVKINSSTLYPYDIIEKYTVGSFWGPCTRNEDATLETQWKQLPNYVEPGTSAIVMADTSGSMCGRPMATSIGLAIYFAERNVGAYHNLFMSFSGCPRFHKIKGDTLKQKIDNIDKSDWQNNTDLKAAFKLILKVAIENNVPPEEMPKSIIVISDMEIDFCGNREWTFYDKMAAKFEQKGYNIPNIIFWNVRSRHDVFHADATRKGVQLVSGQSATVFKQLVGCVGMTPVEMMDKVINGKRYDPITIAPSSI